MTDADDPRRRAGDPVVVPASAIQEQMWRGEMLRGVDNVYTTAEAMAVDTAVDPARLANAVGMLQERHEALRTTFASDSGGLWQVIHVSYHVPLLTFSIDSDDGDARFADILSTVLDEPFGLDNPPLWRCVVAGSGPITYLALVMHHIVADGISTGIILDELGTLYAGGELPDRPRPYRDFSARQREWLNSAAGKQAERYWRDELAGSPPVTTFPGPWSVTSHRAERASFPIPGDVVRRVAEVALAEGATPYLVYLAAFAVLLARRSRRRDLVIGVPGANRADQEHLTTVGLFVNPLPLRLRLPERATLRQAIAVARDALLDGLEHQEFPFAHIVKAAGYGRAQSQAQGRKTGRNPLFQVMVAERSGQEQQFSFAGHPARRLETYTGTAKYDLMATFPESDDPLGMVIEFDLGLYDRRYVDRVGEEYLQLLGRLLADPAGSPAAEPAAEAGEPSFIPPQRRFRRLAVSQPDHVAVVAGTDWCSYAELDQRSDRIARALRAGGVGRGAVVGIRLPRGPDFAAAVIAVAKLGAAYLPTDGRWPELRIGQALAQSAAAALIVADDGQLAQGSCRGIAVLSLASVPSVDGGGALGIAEVRPEDLAIVIYTSGSTGDPKGVMVTYGSISRLLADDQCCAVHDDDRVAQHSNLAFDATTYELWGALSSGATAVMAPADDIGPAAYADLFTASTVAFISTGLFSELVHQPRCRSALRGLRLLLVGGDTLDPAVLAGRSGLGQVALHVYGPTETTTFATAGPLDRRTPRETVPIGSPLAGYWCYVLDADFEPVPPGAEGELYIGGAGVGRGYLGRPGLTAQRFRPDPERPGAQVYATGDWVRLLDDGAIDFIGRRDQQVKVHGFRVELGEIEAVLRADPAVQRVRVVTTGSGAADRALVAVVQLKAGAAEAAVITRLTASLRTRLPTYMQPRELIATGDWPLTPNGKLDISALLRRPQPEHLTGQGRAGQPRAGQAESAEQQMAALWRRVLKTPVGEAADFFALGGDSLTMLRLLEAVETECGVTLRPRDVFDNPGLESFTSVVADRVREGALASAGRPLSARPTRPNRIPVSYAQRRLWFLSLLEDTGTAYNVAIAFRLTGGLNLAALASGVDDVVARHETLRTVFPARDNVPCQVVLTDRSRWPKLTVQEANGGQISAVLAQAANETFDLTADPPLRARVYRLGSKEHVLLLLMHHIAVDGLSLAPLCRDLSAAYAARMSGCAPDWAPLPIQYADYSLWQEESLGDERDPGSPIASQRAYWAEQLRGLPERLELPADEPLRPAPRHRAGHVPIMVGRETCRRLAALAAAQGATMFMVLHAGLAALLARLGAGDDIPIGSPVAGRSKLVTGDLVGFFVNTLVLRADTSGDPTFTDLLGRVRATDLAAFAHQDLPFEQVVDVVNPTRSLSWHPLFQVMLAFDAGADVQLVIVGAQAVREPVHVDHIAYDLAFRLHAPADSSVIDGMLEYDRDLFGAETAAGIAARLPLLLAAAAAEPGRPISQISLLTGAERDALGGSDTAGRYPDDRTVPELFFAQAARTPEAMAADGEGVRLTYGELAARAEAIAAQLIKLGVRPETPVGVCANRGPLLLACLLGVLAAGGCYVLLDPAHPGRRQSWILQDCGARLVLVADGLQDRLPAGAARQLLVRMDEVSTGHTARLTTPSLARPDNLAYVIYTSGSTGHPKGVMVTHRGLANYLLWCVGELGDAAAFGSFGHSPASVDFAVTSLYTPLLTGGRVDFPAAGAGLAELTDEITTPGRRIGLLRLTPSHIEAIDRTLGASPGRIEASAIVVGGEPFTQTAASTLRRLAPRAAIYNHYGPSEAVVGRCAYRLAHGWPSAGATGTVPIGRPIADTRLYVLDANLLPVPDGVRGELFIGGTGLARGYLHRPGLTAERFLADPYGPGGARMYRTGDLVRRNGDGELVFLGRADDQVKIRGFRVEPAEAAAVLARQPGVARAAAIVRESRPGELALIGYAVPEGGSILDTGKLRSSMADQLPDYLVPAAIVLLDELPLTAGGKLDRAALPAPVATGGPGNRQPSTAAEALLCGQIAKTLGLHSADPDASFFELGGNSLNGVALVNDLRLAGVDLPLRVLFEAQTAARMARALASGVVATQSDSEFGAELVLDPTITAPPRAPATDTMGGQELILLTGATGFLGAFLLSALLDRTTAQVACLVRASSPDEATRLVRRALREYRLWDPAYQHRITGLVGDLAEPLLGLPADRFRELAGSLSAIYHCGARVNAVDPYRRLKAANVLGTQEIIRLAASHRPTPLHYVSTVSTLIAAAGNPDLLGEDRRVEAASVQLNGYVRSKWAAEELVRQARPRGVPARVYRPGHIGGHSVTGAMGRDDALWHYVRACIEIGAAPRQPGWAAETDLVPVDYVAHAIVALALALAPATAGTAYNLVAGEPTPLALVLERVRAAGHLVEVVDNDEWARRLAIMVERIGANPASSVPAVAVMQETANERPAPRRPKFGRRNAERDLASSGLRCPQVNAAIIDRYLAYLVDIGFLPEAAGPATASARPGSS